VAQINKVLVCGASELHEAHLPFAQELGRRLMLETKATLTTGGLKWRQDPSKPALDGVVAEEARRAVQHIDDVARRIVTFLPEYGRDDPRHERVSIGTVIRVPYADRRTRRYAMVLQSDAVIGVGGSELTRDVLDLAYITGKPLIPIPSTGGAALDCWTHYGSDLHARFGGATAEIANDLKDLEDKTSLSNGVSACVRILNRILRRRCFVAMPFHATWLPNVFETILEVFSDDYHVVRLDQESFSGSIVEGVWRSIRDCDVAVIDLTGNHPNVYYELGIAHALNKPTLMLVYSKTNSVPTDIPFDVRVQRILTYGTEQTLRAHLKGYLESDRQSAEQLTFRAERL
jgi:hypothetical protein